MAKKSQSNSQSKSKPPIVLVDGSSYLYRAFHIPNLQNLENSEGMPTGAIRGVISMLNRLLGNEKPSHIAVVFDAKGKTFRHDMYKEYKANRPPMPDELRVQIEPLHDMVRALGLPLICESGVEADDVIGTLAKQASEQGYEVLVSTGDKDMAQLVNGQVTLVNTMTDTKMDADGVMGKFGVAPHQIIEYLALMGDKSDNIPGVPSVGPKTAAKWLNEYETLDEIIKNADAIKGKVGEKFRAHIDQLPMSVDLTTIRCDLELSTSIDELKIQTEDVPKLRQLYSHLEFKTWLKKLNEEHGDADRDDVSAESSESSEAVKFAEIEKASYELILTKKDFNRWLKKLQQANLVAFDTETDSLDYMRANVVGLSFAIEAGEAAYVPLAHNYPGAPEQLDRDEVLKSLEPILNDSKAKIIGHNLKYDRSVLLNHGIQLNGIQHDTMLESYVCNSVASRHDLDTLCEKHLQHTNIHFEDVAGKGVKQITFDQVDLGVALDYAAEDADMVLRLHQEFWSELSTKKKQKVLYETIELPMLKVLSNIERNGVLIDDKQLAKQGKQLTKRITEVEKIAFELAEGPFNLSSPKQIQEILFEKQGIPVIRKTPKGQPSTAEDVLQELAVDYPLPKIILEHRTLSKLKSTYVDKLPALINTKTKRVHTSYHQAVAITGRLSSSDPNLQNIPIRTEEGRRVRQAFIAPKGYQVLAADYSQIELRIMAHLSQDERLCEAFAQGEDIHRATAAEVFGLGLDKVESEQRRAAKAINFGLIYGMSAFGLAKQLGITRTEAQQYVSLYFERYPGVKKYMDGIRELAREQGYVETLFGRRLYLPDINNKNVQRRQYAERTAINAPMQGTAADIIKRAMINIDVWLQDKKSVKKIAGQPECIMIMQVHDELVFEVEESVIGSTKESVIEQMESAAELSVPLVVDAAIGNNWDEAH
ncbi:MAG: DNA polymerase I [Gammaproteobacteria bacterium]|nr:MAG: DNA polymerase I [Gammaproteobacteria bacterium]